MSRLIATTFMVIGLSAGHALAFTGPPAGSIVPTLDFPEPRVPTTTRDATTRPAE